MKLVALLLLAACTTTSEPLPFEPDQVPTGIYRLDISTTADTCDPPRSTSSATVAISKIPDGISATDAGNNSAIAVGLTADAGYALEVPATPSMRLDPCAPSANSVVFGYTLTGASADRFEVIAGETWTMPTACPPSVDWRVNVSRVPHASCTATRELRYTLVSACAAPCTLSAAPACVCP